MKYQDIITEMNRRLCEGNRVEFFEYIETELTEIKLSEALKNGDVPFTAKISQADRKNLNRRIYPKEVLGPAIEKAKKKCKEGKFTGAIDHSYNGLRDTCIAWDDVWMEDDGACYGKGRMIDGANHVAHLKSLIKSGVKIGFSTTGWGSAHRPGEEERRRYGLGENDDCVIIDPNYEMDGIDPVDRPSCFDAWIKNAERASDNPKHGEKPVQENTMKTLAELQAQNPELFKLHQDAVNAAVAAAVKPLNDQIATLTKTREAVQSTLDSFSKLEGVNVPFKDVSAEQAATQIASAKAETQLKATELASTKTQLEAANAQIAALTSEKAENEKKVADANRKAEVISEAAKALKGHKYEKQLTPQITAMAENPTFDKTALAKFITDKAAEYDAVYTGTVPPLHRTFDPKKEGSAGISEDSKAMKEAFAL